MRALLLFFVCCVVLIRTFSPLLANEAASHIFKLQSIDKKFILVPVKTGAPKIWVSILINDTFQYDFQVEIAPGIPDFYATIEVGKWMGKKLDLVAEGVSATSKWRDGIQFSDEMSGKGIAYTEKYRPQFHFSPRRGWANDPNGLIYYDGVYHLFFQHNPFGVSWGNMTWGHAISTDLLHWKELPNAIFPDENGVVYSGSAVVDWNNTSGFQKNPVEGKFGKIKNPPLVALYTSQGPELRTGGIKATQSLAYSLDEGMSWIKYSGNPVLPNLATDNRDPKVFWYSEKKIPTAKGHWVMALYMENENFTLFTSDDLIHWEKSCDINHVGGSECPDLFELPVDGNQRKTRWVFWVANGRYLLGSFDGRTFIREQGPFVAKLGGGDNEYAAQSYSDIPEKDGRRIQLSWLSQGIYPEMPFNQQFSIPRSLSLRTTTEGERLFIEPVKEVESLRKPEAIVVKERLQGVDKPVKLEQIKGELQDITIVFDLNRNGENKAGGILGFEMGGLKTTYDVDKKLLNMAGVRTTLEPEKNKIELRFLFDRMSVEVYANKGRVAIAKCFVPNREKSVPVVFGTKDLATFNLQAYALYTVWRNTVDGELPEELIACGGRKILIIDPAQSDNTDVRINWEWDISEATGLPESYQKYLNPLDECKPVDNNTKILVTSSGGGVVLLDRKTKDILFYANAPMAHSAEYLPGDRIVVALSNHPAGDCIELYDIHTPEKCIYRDTLYSGHGAVWIPERERLFVLGGYELRAYSLKNWDTEQPELQLEQTWKITGISGHDLISISKDELVLTEAMNAWLFDIPTERFTPFAPLNMADIKSVNYNKKTRNLVYTKGENDEWWTHHIYLENPDKVITIPEIELYKVRVYQK